MDMHKEKELPKRKSTRLKDFDYSSAGAYFITICTESRRQILSRIVGGDVPGAPHERGDVPDAPNVGGDVLDAPHERCDVPDAPHVGGDVLDAPHEGGDVPGAPKNIELLPYGKIAERYIRQLNDFYDHVRVDQYVIMPNHIHMILIVSQSGASRTTPPTKQHTTVSQFVSTFKRFCNKECGRNIWKRYFHDHIIRDREDYEEHIKYIYENPIRWYYDELYAEE